MTVREFCDKYLSLDATVCFYEGNGNINYTGRLADAPFWTWNGRDFISVDGLGEESDLLIQTSERK